MKLPIVLCDDGDICLFKSTEDLENYVESPDIADYRVFDANGDVLHLTTPSFTSTQKGKFGLVQISPVRVKVVEPRINATHELEELLRGFLFYVTGVSHKQNTLPELLEFFQKTVGFT